MLRDNRTERRGAVLRAFRGESAGRGAVPYFPRPRIAKCVSELGFRKMFQTNVDIHKNELGIFPVRKEICLNFGNVPQLLYNN